MSRRQQVINRILAIILVAFGVVFGGTWNRTKFCLGDQVFSLMGFPAWSNGTSGTHYPALVGLVFILIGVGVLNVTLQKKARLWMWIIAIALLVVLNFGLTYM